MSKLESHVNLFSNGCQLHVRGLQNKSEESPRVRESKFRNILGGWGGETKKKSTLFLEVGRLNREFHGNSIVTVPEPSFLGKRKYIFL